MDAFKCCFVKSRDRTRRNNKITTIQFEAKRKGNINLYNLKNIFETEGNSVEKSSLSHRCGYAYPSLELTLSKGEIAKFTLGKL